MKRLSILIVVFAACCSSLLAAEEKKTVVDYFLRLPDKTFEAPPRAWLDNAKVIDKQNGYMSVTGDGAQPNFEVALFRYRDGRPLLALCEGELEGENSQFLSFFEMDANGKMKSVSRSIFPFRDAGNGQGDWKFELPRQGRTVLVRSQKNEKTIRKFIWDGQRFVETK